MDLNLKNKVFLVSGGAKGIGEAIVREIAKEGGIPIILDRSEKEAHALMEELVQKNQSLHFIKKELGSAASCQDSVEAALEKEGRIDGVINNAGVNDGVGLESGSPEAWLNSLNKNLHHYYYLVHYALPALKKTSGAIINISSKTALTGQGGTSAYAAAKGAQLALTREWAVELLPHQIRVNAIVPSEVMTPLYKNWLQSFDDPEAKRQSIIKNIPLGNRMTKASEIAAMVAFLLSDRAAHITGQYLFVDGGYVHLDRALAGLDK